MSVPYGDVLFSEMYGRGEEEKKREKAIRGAGNSEYSEKTLFSSRDVPYGGSRVIEGGAIGEVGVEEGGGRGGGGRGGRRGW